MRNLGYAMDPEGNETTKDERRIEIHPIDIATAAAELQRRLPEIQASVQRLEKCKMVSRKTMQLEVNV